jgi:hypothetical protein
VAKIEGYIEFSDRKPGLCGIRVPFPNLDQSDVDSLRKLIKEARHLEVRVATAKDPDYVDDSVSLEEAERRCAVARMNIMEAQCRIMSAKADENHTVEIGLFGGKYKFTCDEATGFTLVAAMERAENSAREIRTAADFLINSGHGGSEIRRIGDNLDPKVESLSVEGPAVVNKRQRDRSAA